MSEPLEIASCVAPGSQRVLFRVPADGVPTYAVIDRAGVEHVHTNALGVALSAARRVLVEQGEVWIRASDDTCASSYLAVKLLIRPVTPAGPAPAATNGQVPQKGTKPATAGLADEPDALKPPGPDLETGRSLPSGDSGNHPGRPTSPNSASIASGARLRWPRLLPGLAGAPGKRRLALNLDVGLGPNWR